MFKRLIKTALSYLGYELNKQGFQPPTWNISEQALINSVSSYTLTSPERIIALRDATHYVVHNKIEGDFVECGVWRGGSIMVILKTLLALGVRDRTVRLFDTFDGMTKPTKEDRDFNGNLASDLLAAEERTGAMWARATLEDVKQNVLSVGYPEEKIIFVKGDVLSTLPSHVPDKIALLRLDTDWYASTKHEMIHLYPRLSKHGVLLIDDYGHFQGAKQAIDEYFNGSHPLLHRIDYTGRAAIKLTD